MTTPPPSVPEWVGPVVDHLRTSVLDHGRARIGADGDRVVLRPASAPSERHACLSLHHVTAWECHYVVGRTEVREEHGAGTTLGDRLSGVVAWARDCIDGTLEETCRYKAVVLVHSRLRGLHGGGQSSGRIHLPWGRRFDHVAHDPYPGRPGPDGADAIL